MRKFLHGQRRIKLSFVALTLVSVVVIAYATVSIQRSRLSSCKRTYQSFPLMFRPFFPEDMTKWNTRTLDNWDKLHTRADELSAKCDDQIKTYLFK